MIIIIFIVILFFLILFNFWNSIMMHIYSKVFLKILRILRDTFKNQSKGYI